MPHITIEYSANVADQHDISALVDAVHQAALDHGSAPLAGLRTRAVARSHYRIADGHPDNAFVAVTARIGPGRTPEVKVDLMRTLMDVTERSLEEQAGSLAVAYSVEIQEIDAAFRENRNHIAERLHQRTEDDGAGGR